MTASELAWIDLPAPWAPGCTAVRVSDDAPAASAGLVVVDAGEALARLHPDERSAGSSLPLLRRREWAAGRLALRAALERAGCAWEDSPVGTDDRGAPRVPVGFTGSISHKRGLAVAIAAREVDIGGWRVGIDVEVDAASKVGIEGRVLTAGERAVLDGIADAEERGREVMLRFAVKEAVYKAVDPYVRRYVGFQEVEVVVGESGGVVVASGLGLVVEAAWRRWEGCVLAVARARR